MRERDDIVALDSSIILHPAVWEASGHVAGFADSLVDCRFCKRRYRADHLDDAQCGQRRASAPARRSNAISPQPRQFNLMFSTRIGPVEETGQDAYLRPETAQGIFVNFKNVAQIARRKPPFGIAQIGKAFRNEITPGNFIFRTLESSSRWRWSTSCRLPSSRVVLVLGRTASCVASPLRPAREPTSVSACTTPRNSALLVGDERHRVPLSHRLVRARGGSPIAATST